MSTDNSSKKKRPLACDPESVVVRNEHAGPKVLGVDNTALWRRRKDPDFPKAIRLGPNSSGFLRTDLMAWLESQKGR